MAPSSPCKSLIAALAIFIVSSCFSSFLRAAEARPISRNPFLHEKHLEKGRHQPGIVAGMERMGEGTCSKDDIDVYQAASSPLPSGIPTYTVQVINTCVNSEVGISQVHLSCGWFSSARLVNPKIFRRLGYDDCLVNDGRSILPGGAISFQYANTYPYKLAVASASCMSRKSR